MPTYSGAIVRAIAAIAATVALVTTAFVVPIAVGSVSSAAADTGTGTPVISLTRTVAAQTLFGTNVSVTLTAQQVSGGNGYNLTFSDVLPAGATFSGGTAPSQQIPQLNGTTLLTWLNQSDMLVGTTSAISYTYSYPTTGAAPFAMGTTISGTAQAYVNSAPRTAPTFDATGAIIPSTVTGSAPSTSSTQLVPYTVQKTLVGVPENELLRGVHDHKYQYQITITNNPVTATSAPVLTDYLPADLEFLGCSNVDNSASGTEEYTGSGPLTNGTFPAAVTSTSCAPSGQPTATTVTGDPDGAGQLPSGVYTKVVWPTFADFAPGDVRTIDYAAAVPMRENVASAANATANLDNNTGALITDEQPVVNWATVGASNGGTPYSVGAYQAATAEDLAIQKTVSTPTLVQGQTSVWTLNLETSEYAISTGQITVTDVVPSGLDIASTGAPTPTQTPNNNDGTTTLTWTLPGYTAKNGTTQLTYTTTTRATYRGTSNPIAAQDSWSNNVNTSATATLRTGPTSTAPSLVTDASSASQHAGPITISKKVLPAPASVSADCLGVDTASFVTDASGVSDAAYHWGDTVCWLLTVTFPGALNTLNTSVQDLLPPGFSYRGYYATPASDVSITSAPPTSDSGTETLESWGINNAAQGTTFQVVVASAVTSVTAAAPVGSIQGNLMKVSYANTAGAIFQLRAAALAKVSRPLLSVAKSATPTSGAAGSVVTFAVVVSNSGTQDTVAQIMDALPAGLSCVTISVPQGASCSGSTMTWTSVAVAASGSTTLNYTATLPATVAAGDSFTNNVTIPSYTSTTNTGGTETYVDSPVASASATVTVPAATVTKTATPTARIGDTVTWVVTGHIPAMTTLYSSPALVDTVPSGYAVNSATATLVGVSTPVTTSGNTVTVPLGGGTSYVNNTTSEQQLVVTITGRLTDTSANRLGAITTNSATLSWKGTSDGSTRTATGTASTTVVEPLLTMTKTDNAAGKAVPGATVTFTLTVKNTGTSTAYDTIVTDTVPTGVTPQKLGGGVAGDGDTVAGTGAGIWSASTRTVTFPTQDIAPNAISAVTIVVAVDDPLTSNGTIVNNAKAITTSLPGTDPNERTSTSARNTGYTVTSSDTLSNPVIAITKTASPTTATIGNQISYTLKVTIPASTVADNLTVIDSLPTGIAWQSLTSSSCTQGGSGCALTASVVGTPSASDRKVAYLLGDATTTAAARVVTIVYVGQVVLGATPGAMINTAQLRFDAPGSPTFTPSTIADVMAHNYTTTGNQATATVTEQEPALGISKLVTGISGGGAHLSTTPPRAIPGDVIAYSVTVTNSGTWPAYDATVTDPLPASVDCSWVGAISNGGSCTNASLSWQLAGPIAPGAGNAVTLTYTLTVPVSTSNTVFPGTAPELPNTADIPSYFAEPAAIRGSTVGQYKQYTEDPHSTATVQLDLATLSGNISEDWDLSGSKTAGDVSLANVPVTAIYAGADGVIGTSDDETFSTQTDAAGNYSVINLPGGTYRVTVDPVAIAAMGLTGSWDADGGALGVWNGTVTENGNRTNVDFGYKGTGSIGNTVWFDQNSDGSHASTEPGIAGATVTLTWNDTGKTLVTTTDASGFYSFANLPAGGYTVVVSSPVGYHPVSDPDTGTTNPDGSSTLALAAGQSNLAQNFGLAGLLSLGSTVWLDRNSNGVQDAGEPGIPHAQVTVSFTPTGGAQTGTFTAITDANGDYTVGDLPPGSYTVSVNPATLPAGATPTFDLDGTSTPNSTAVSLTTVSRTDANFGYDATRSLGGTVWWDYTGDHNPANGPGLGGVVLDVTYYGPDGVSGGGDDISYTTTTHPDGTWSLLNVSQGNYGVVVDTSTVPVGFSATFDSDGPTHGLGASAVTVPASGLTPPQYFGYAGTGSLGDLVFLDRNGDGLQSATPGQEPGIGGVPLTLTTTVGGQTLTLSTTSSSTGAYSFPGLPVGSYTVAITTPTGFHAVSDLDGGDHATTAVSLATGQVRTDVDFGLAGTASISGTVYNDRNADGGQGASEPGVPGVTMTATGTTSTGTVTLTTVTGADGSWSFTGLPVGQWIVQPTANIPAGYMEVSESDGTVNGSISSTLADGETVIGELFGYRGTGSIGDSVYLDQNGSHTASGQPGVPGQQVDLLWAGPDGDFTTSGDNQSFTTTTDSNGNYLFSYLPSGLFRVTVVGGITANAANTGDPDGGTPNTSQLTLTSVAPSNLAQDFGYAAATSAGSNSLGDLVWWDDNGNGVRDPGEPGIPSATVTARWFGPDGLANTADDIVLTTTTNTNGVYGFQGLPDGTYEVSVTGGIYTGLAPSVDVADGPLGTLNGSSTVTLSGGSVRSDVNFGYTGTGSIGDHVYLDENGDGAQQSGEPGIPGATVTVVWAGPDGIPGNGDDRTFTETTGADGRWLANHLPAGGYTVAVTGTPPGLANTGDPDGGGDSRSQLILAPGQNNLDQDFGYQGSASVGDTVFLDVDGDGVQTGNEPGIPGVVVTVTSAGADGILGNSDDIVATRTTDAHGRYSVGGLPAGAVQVNYDPATLPAGDVPSSDLDGGASLSSAQLVLASGDARTDVDFSARGTGAVSGVVYDDSNADGKLDQGERGVGGVEITVTFQGPSGPVVVSTTTAADGSWSVDGLPAGSYTAAVVMSSVPSGFHSSTVTLTTLTVTAGGVATAVFGITTRPLATTGTDVLGGVGLGMMLLVLGAALMLLRRRRVA